MTYLHVQPDIELTFVIEEEKSTTTLMHNVLMQMKNKVRIRAINIALKGFWSLCSNVRNKIRVPLVFYSLCLTAPS